MLLFRPVKKKDINDLYRLAKLSSVGLTTLPANKKVLNQKILHSIQSFAKKTKKVKDEYYLFVLEDIEQSKVVGCSAIESSIGNDAPFYSYRISKIERVNYEMDIRKVYHYLNLVNDYQGSSEICTLYLEPDYRKNGNGLFLSRARFLFMAQFPSRFSEIVIAEMRGVSDKNGESPFWNSFGKNFFMMDFKSADEMTTISNKQFIADLMPRMPVHYDLLTKKAQSVIGVPHDKTKPAMHILEKEGFEYRGYVDIFDAGPTLETKLENIKTVKESKLYVVSDIVDAAESNASEKYLVSNNKIDFKALHTNVMLINEKSCVISKKCAKQLGIKRGDKVRICR